MSQPDNHDVFMDLVTRHQSAVFSYIFALVHNMEDTRDIHQDTLLVLWKKFDEFEQGTNFLGWAIRVAQFEVRKYRRQRGRREVVLSDQVLEQLAESFASEDGLEVSARKNALATCVEKLREVDRHLIELCYQAECSIRQVARDLDRSEQSVGNSLRRIRASLFECIERTVAAEERR